MRTGLWSYRKWPGCRSKTYNKISNLLIYIPPESPHHFARHRWSVTREQSRFLSNTEDLEMCGDGGDGGGDGVDTHDLCEDVVEATCTAIGGGLGGVFGGTPGAVAGSIAGSALGSVASGYVCNEDWP